MSSYFIQNLFILHELEIKKKASATHMQSSTDKSCSCRGSEIHMNRLTHQAISYEENIVATRLKGLKQANAADVKIATYTISVFTTAKKITDFLLNRFIQFHSDTWVAGNTLIQKNRLLRFFFKNLRTNQKYIFKYTCNVNINGKPFPVSFFLSFYLLLSSFPLKREFGSNIFFSYCLFFR